MPNKNTLQHWQARQKGRTLKILKELSRKIEREELIVNDAGFWVSNASHEIIFRFVTISRDSQQDLKKFEQIS